MKLHILKQKSYNCKWKNACTCITNYEFVRVNSLNFLGTGNFFFFEVNPSLENRQGAKSNNFSYFLSIMGETSKFQVPS